MGDALATIPALTITRRKGGFTQPAGGPFMNSSAIADVAYESASGTLHITFRSGGTYTFHGVPHSVYRGLITASSPGSYYHHYIRGRYR